MKYLYIKILILLAILIPPTLMIESEAAGGPFFVNDFESGATIYYPKTGNLCSASSYFQGTLFIVKLVLPKNLTLSGYKKLKGTYHGYRIDKAEGKFQIQMKKAHNWRKTNASETFEGNNNTEIGGSYRPTMAIYNDCNNNKMDALLKRYRAQNKSFGIYKS